jgi:hypothetical protein
MAKINLPIGKYIFAVSKHHIALVVGADMYKAMNPLFEALRLEYAEYAEYADYCMYVGDGSTTPMAQPLKLIVWSFKTGSRDVDTEIGVGVVPVFSPDSESMFYASIDGTVTLCYLGSCLPWSEKKVFRLAKNSLLDTCRFSADSKSLIMLPGPSSFPGGDGAARSIAVATGIATPLPQYPEKVIRARHGLTTIYEGLSGGGWGCDLSWQPRGTGDPIHMISDARYLTSEVSGNTDRIIIAFDRYGQNMVAIYSIATHEKVFEAMGTIRCFDRSVLSADERHAAFIREMTALVVDVTSGTAVECAAANPIKNVKLSPKGTHVAIVTIEGQASLVRVSDKAILWRSAYESYTDTFVSFSHDGGTLYVTSLVENFDAHREIPSGGYHLGTVSSADGSSRCEEPKMTNHMRYQCRIGRDGQHFLACIEGEVLGETKVSLTMPHA